MHFRNIRYIVSSNRSDHITTPGIDWGSPLFELCSVGNHAIWYHSGHTGWSGRGMTAYYPSVYMIVRKAGDRATMLFEVEPGRRWHAVLGRLNR